ncbi:peptide-methionine (S)-S-oxide reductase MsrA [Sulfurimonas sp. SAG-AH-194-I05]|nr:peptide-methionine (S)-S-oxide reductase MsrA [Sulfurimonas sp. SAG-AH-194-I05]MDF1874843.1 peptide-methionine (S)-S-oxide reductase MsrA [Sulfurimonas sp. SAG-AH-194-I05]
MIIDIVFAAGCFWGVEKYFEGLDGVVKAESGYAGGNYANPTYTEVLAKRRLKYGSTVINHTEVVKVSFDNTKIDAKTLIKSFWELHNPTQVNRQGHDVGNNYRSALYWTTENQKNIALRTKAEYQKLLSANGFGKIATEMKPLDTFYIAEENHQDYLKRNPNGYCPNHSTGVKFEKEQEKTDVITPLGGKEIIVITAEGFCPYCEKFEKDVSNAYNGSIPMRTVTAKSLKGFDIKTELYATPTILHIEDGKEVFAHRGYIRSKDFYERLGAFKLGEKSEGYKVAFYEGTDRSFCKQYDIFKNTPDGVFIDKISGDVLFDTNDRFNSGTGWLSFYKSVDNTTTELKDNKYGMQRIEVRAKKSGIHLGHVFPLSDGRRRFCINATVLEFVPRDKN